MCHTSTPPPSSDLSPSNSNSIPTTRDSLSRLAAPRRKNRTKTRKPKFLSLRLQLSSNQSDPMAHHQQLNLFPLHPENLIHDRDVMHDDGNVALLFTSYGPATLNGLLEQDSTTTTTTTTNTTVSEEDSVSPQCWTAYPFHKENGSALVRKAMKRRSEEDGREERWVCYSEVTSYCSANTTESTAAPSTSSGLLSLKLNYEGILNAWSDKGPLYVPAETPHAVPDFLDHVLPHHPPHVVWGHSSVVEKAWEESEKKEKRKEEMGQREASVLRYKEKRRSRLFSKRIRYEVRKLNAEQRPRMKGRFVKRD
ncbi:protein CHLOROPLAST IMPORT APPARATUS 2 [Neltuma alba]|uniref:protein CHLOROPLAST IMPORT APPARATUS 2 n=1 Tax=Neltuma alba TaxID=207710 RepID=UPI0010A3BC37|nr:protein CHLOROPLAST IMPORT APPARATUS 2-like [Prosopis alba]